MWHRGLHFLRAAVVSCAVATTASCGGGSGGGGGPPIPLYEFASIQAQVGPTVLNFGGAGTVSVGVVRNGAGDYVVTFTGSYPGVSSRSDVTVLVSIQDTNNYDIATGNMDAGSASSSTTDRALAAFLRRPAGDPAAALRLCLTPAMADMIGTAGPIVIAGEQS